MQEERPNREDHSLAETATAEFERADQADHETRLQVLEELYRSLEFELDEAGAEALR